MWQFFFLWQISESFTAAENQKRKCEHARVLERKSGKAAEECAIFVRSIVQKVRRVCGRKEQRDTNRKVNEWNEEVKISVRGS